MTTNNKRVSSGSLVTPVKPTSLKLRLVKSKEVEIQKLTLTDPALLFTHTLDSKFWN